jgi:hypothetical protein
MITRAAASALLATTIHAPIATAQVTPAKSADALEVVSGLALSIPQPPGPDDYAFAAALLSIATDLDPDDPDLARSLVLASWSAGDQQGVIDATRDIVRLDPDDTVAQLRLISAIINEKQTIEERLALYNRFSSDDASLIDPSVRSRLLLDAALLERERGNAEGFLVNLRKSARLDSTHKEAQSLLAQTLGDRTEDNAALLRLQLRVFYADPLDPHVHIAIAKLCAREGATDSAWRFLNNGIRIFQMDQGNTPASLREQQLSLLWQYEGPQAILDQLNPTLYDERGTLMAQINARRELNEPIDDLGDPRDIRYDAGIDRIRLLAAHILGDQETVDSTLADLERGLMKFNEQINEQLKERGADRMALLRAFLKEIVTLQTYRAIVGVDPEIIKNDVDRIVARAPDFEPIFKPFEPFSIYAEGNYELARQTATDKLAPSASRDLLIAFCSDKLGETDRAIEEYLQLTRAYPLQAAGSIGRSRVAELRPGLDQTTEVGREMSRLEKDVPLWIDEMITRPQNTMRLTMRATERAFSSIDPARVTIELQNITSIPLAVGPANPIDSNLLIIPGFKEHTDLFTGTPKARVIDMGRKLRLKPLETITFTTDPDSIQTKWLMRAQPASTFRQRWRALQGFKALPIGGLINSAFSLTTETDMIERRRIDAVAAPLEDLLTSIRTGDSRAMEQAVASASAILYEPRRRPELTSADLARFADACWERYERETPWARAWMLSTLPTQATAPSIASFDLRVSESLTAASLAGDPIDPAEFAAALATRAADANSPLIEVALTHDDPRVRTIAAYTRDQLNDIQRVYATIDQPFTTFTPTQTRGYGN